MRKINKKHQTLQEALVDLYISIKPSKEEEGIINQNVNPEEFDRLCKTDPKTIIEYIKSTIDVIVQMLVDEKLNEYRKANDDSQEYENLLIKLEGDIRGHIRTEHQLKLHSERLQCELEIMERENEELKLKKKKKYISCTTNSYCNNSATNPNMTSSNNQYDDYYNSKTEMTNLKMLLKSYEDQTLKLAANEKKLKSQLVQKEKELKHIETNCKDQIRLLNKKLFSYEEKIRISNTIRLSSCRDDSLNKNNSTVRKTTSANKNCHNNHNNTNTNNNDNQKELVKKNTFQGVESKEKLLTKGDNKIVNKSHSLSFVFKKTEGIATLSKKHEELLAKLDKCSKKIIKESSLQNIKKKKGHNRHKSMQESLYLKSQKEMLFNSNISNNHHYKIDSQSKLEKTCNTGPENNFVINQIGAPFVNNINIYTTNATNSNNDNNTNNTNINMNTNTNHNSNSLNNKSSLNSNYTHKIFNKLNPEIYRRKGRQGTPCLHHQN